MGPIIKELQTNSSILAGGSSTHYVKADGRNLRVFVKYIGAHTDTDATLTVKPVAHYSTGKVTHEWPVIATGETDGIVSPDTGTSAITSSGSGAKQLEVFVSQDYSCSEFEVKLAVANQNTSAVFLLIELV
jgi:hypothetical protein